MVETMRAHSLITAIILVLTAHHVLAADTISNGSEIKKTTGTLIEMQAGDVACYLTFKDDQNLEFREMAGFEICEQENLIGKSLALQYEAVEILADICQGNPDCKHSKLELLVTDAQVIGGKTEKPALIEDVGPDGLTSKELKAFLKALQFAVIVGNPAEVARFVSFPLRVNYDNGKHRKITKTQFVPIYNKIFTPKIKAALLSQQAEDLFRSWRGAMVGGGELWLSGVCTEQNCKRYELLITSVNVPDTLKNKSGKARP